MEEYWLKEASQPLIVYQDEEGEVERFAVKYELKAVRRIFSSSDTNFPIPFHIHLKRRGR